MVPRNVKHSPGFTLAELLVVIAIIGILVAVSIPVFSAQTAKAKRAADMANVRAAKAAAVTAYISNMSIEDTTYYYDAASGTVKESKDGIAGYGKSGVEVEGAGGVPYKNGTARIVSVKIKRDGSSTASWGTSEEDFLAKAAEREASYNSVYHSGNDLIAAMGTLLPVDAAIFGSKTLYQASGNSSLFWRPKTVTVNNRKLIFLYAGNGDSGHANWQGYAVYYNGTTYISTNMAGTSINRNSVNFTVDASFTDFETYLLSGKWKKAD